MHGLLTLAKLKKKKEKKEANLLHRLSISSRAQKKGFMKKILTHTSSIYELNSYLEIGGIELLKAHDEWLP